MPLISKSIRKDKGLPSPEHLTDQRGWKRQSGRMASATGHHILQVESWYTLKCENSLQHRCHLEIQMPATNSVNRCLPPYVFFASTPLIRVLEELIIPRLFETFPRTLWNTRVQNCAHKKHTSFCLRSILIFLELELNAGGSCRRLGFKLDLHKESLMIPLL